MIFRDLIRAYHLHQSFAAERRGLVVAHACSVTLSSLLCLLVGVLRIPSTSLPFKKLPDLRKKPEVEDVVNSRGARGREMLESFIPAASIVDRACNFLAPFAIGVAPLTQLLGRAKLFSL